MPESRFASIVRPLNFIAVASLILPCVMTARAEVHLPALSQITWWFKETCPSMSGVPPRPKSPSTVTFRGETKQSIADELGRWSVYLRPGEQGGPFQLQVTGTNKTVLEDVLAGDVWIASGQSNMEFPMAEGSNRGVNHEKEEIAAANYPRIRLLHVATGSSDYPLDNIALVRGWSACTPESVAEFSAVGYFFARDIQQDQDTPIGVIDVTWAGRRLKHGPA